MFMMDGQAEVNLPIYLIPDSVPEVNETFRVRLLPQNIQGGAILGGSVTCEVTILQNDYPHGLIGMMQLVIYFLLFGRPTSKSRHPEGLVLVV